MRVLLYPASFIRRDMCACVSAIPMELMSATSEVGESGDVEIDLADCVVDSMNESLRATIKDVQKTAAISDGLREITPYPVIKSENSIRFIGKSLYNPEIRNSLISLFA